MQYNGENDISDRYNRVIRVFVDKLKLDNNVIAAYIYGSALNGDVWEKSDINITIIVSDEKVQHCEYTLTIDEININIDMLSRTNFMKVQYGFLQDSIQAAVLAASKFLFIRDETIKDYYESVRYIGERDRELQIFRHGSNVVQHIEKAKKWFYVKRDYIHCYLIILKMVESLASIEALINGESTSRHAMYKAIKYNPEFFNKVFTDFIKDTVDESKVGSVLNEINNYVAVKSPIIFKPVIEYFSNKDTEIGISEAARFFCRKISMGVHEMGMICQWLCDNGVLQKSSIPIKLTTKSKVELDEMAYRIKENHE